MRARVTTLGCLLLLAGLPHPAHSQGPNPFYDKAARFLAARGYGNDPRHFAEVFRVIGSHVPTYVPGLGTDVGRLMMGIERKCPDSLRAMPRCVQIDLLEGYAGQDTSQVGIIPLTFIGPRGGAVLEARPSRDVLADADITARAMHTRVFIPPPLVPLAPSRDSSPTSPAAVKSVPFVQGAMLWVYHQTRDMRYEPLQPSLLDSLRLTFPEAFGHRPGNAHLFVQSPKAPSCAPGAPKGCRRYEVLTVSIGTDTLANRFAIITNAVAIESDPGSELRLATASDRTRRDAATISDRFNSDPKAQPYTKD